jgi:hypothetical protein
MLNVLLSTILESTGLKARRVTAHNIYNKYLFDKWMNERMTEKIHPQI